MISTHSLRYFIRHLLTAKRKGHGIHSPFAYALCEEVFYNTASFYDFEVLNQLRRNLLRDPRTFVFEDLGAGSKTFKSPERKVKDIARKGISPARQAELLYRLINYSGFETCVELGTSLGLTTQYLAMANRSGKVTSIEGSAALSGIATDLAKASGLQNIEFITGAFDTALPQFLRRAPTIDFLYLDGNHTYEATYRYFEMALPSMGEHSVMVLDDIYWSPGMTKAWEEIKRHSSVTLSMDLFYFGLVFFRQEVKEKQEIRLML